MKDYCQLLKYVNHRITQVKLLIYPFNQSEELMDNTVNPSFCFENIEPSLSIGTTSGQTPVIEHNNWPVDFIGMSELQNQRHIWSTEVFWEEHNKANNGIVKSAYCFDITKDLPHIIGQKLSNVYLVRFEDGGAITGLKFRLENDEEIWTGPSSIGTTNIYISNCPEVNSGYSEPCWQNPPWKGYETYLDEIV